MLQETKSTSSNMDSLMSRLWHVSQSISLDSSRASGGLTISWNPTEVDLDHFLASHHCITALFHPIDTNFHGRITNVYGPHLPNQKSSFLNFLQWLFLVQARPMDVLGGDFNLITSLQDKRGGRPMLTEEDKLFKGFIDNSNLIDLHTNNGIHTLNNRRGKSAQIASKLDRFLIT